MLNLLGPLSALPVKMQDQRKNQNLFPVDLYVRYMYIIHMPTIFRIGPFRIIINTADHEPPHVHCVGPGVAVIIEIMSQLVMKNRGVSPKDIKRLREFIESNEEVLLNEWRFYHEEE